MLRKWVFILFFNILIFSTVSAQSAENTVFTCELPYSVGTKKTDIRPGETFMVLFKAESTEKMEQVHDIKITLPLEITVQTPPEGFTEVKTSAGSTLVGKVVLEKNYDQWFDLINLKAASDLPSGEYFVTLKVDNQKEYIYPLFINSSQAETSKGQLELQAIQMPLDNEGRADERMEANTLVLHDYTWDYLKNILSGKGALSKTAQFSHPLTYLGCDFFNPSGEQKALVISAKLYDKSGTNRVDALKMPKVSTIEHEGADFITEDDGLVILTALSEKNQRVLMPIYIDGEFNTGGEYLLNLKVYAAENKQFLTERDLKITLIKQNSWSGIITSAALLLILTAIIYFIMKHKVFFAGMKTRWLVIVSLFGAVSFIAVSIPGTFLLDLSRIVLGPFSFMLTGIFYSTVLYALILSLAVIIPRPGVVSLFTLVRMMINMIVFGHMSPVMILFQGTHMVLLELGLYFAGVTNQKTKIKANILVIALICGIAEAAASYINLQGTIFLYRLYYASWYIALYTLVNGLVYTAVGCIIGIRLGHELKKVGGD